MGAVVTSDADPLSRKNLLLRRQALLPDSQLGALAAESLLIDSRTSSV